MKKLRLFLYVFLPIGLFAQIPNASFENWTAVSTYSVPNSWGTLNNTYTVQTATKGTPGNPGNSYLKLTSRTYGSSVINGIAVSGVLDSVTKLPKSGFPFSQKPLSLTGKWQHMIFDTSQGSAKVYLTRWDNVNQVRVPVANGNLKLQGMAMNWQSFSIPLTYVDSNAPDSCIIYFEASGPYPGNNDYLWIDDLSFSGVYTGVSEKNIDNLIKILPNPTTDNLRISFVKEFGSSLLIKLYDVSGKIVYEDKIKNASPTLNYQIDVKSFTKGFYTIEIINEQQVVSRKLVLE